MPTLHPPILHLLPPSGASKLISMLPIDQAPWKAICELSWEEIERLYNLLLSVHSVKLRYIVGAFLESHMDSGEVQRSNV